MNLDADDVRNLLDAETERARSHMPPLDSVIQAAARRRRRRGTAVGASVVAALAAGGVAVAMATGVPTSSPVAPAGDAPRWVSRATCQPSSKAEDSARAELTEQRTNFDVVDAFATQVERTETARSDSPFGGVYWQDSKDGLVVQLSGNGDEDASRILDLAAQEQFPYPVSFTRALSLTERRDIADKIRTNGIDGHPVHQVSTNDMCHDLTVTMAGQSAKPLTNATANKLSQHASARYDGDCCTDR